MMPVSVKNLTAATKEMLQIEEKTDFVPYILLKAVGRDDPDIQFGPTYSYPDGTTAVTPEYLIFPMKYSEFLLLEESPDNPENTSLFLLFKFMKNADEFGFARELYSLVMLNRLLFPLYFLLLFILLGSFAWNNRVGGNQMFRFSWVFSFPFLIVISAFFYKFAYILFKLINYTILCISSGIGALVLGAGIYILLMVILSISFLSRHT